MTCVLVTKKTVHLDHYDYQNMKAITINVSLETRNTVVIVAVDDWLALPLENVVARGVEDAG